MINKHGVHNLSELLTLLRFIISLHHDERNHFVSRFQCSCVCEYIVITNWLLCFDVCVTNYHFYINKDRNVTKNSMYGPCENKGRQETALSHYYRDFKTWPLERWRSTPCKHLAGIKFKCSEIIFQKSTGTFFRGSSKSCSWVSSGPSAVVWRVETPCIGH